MSYLVLAKRRREVFITHHAPTATKAEELAQDSVITGTVEEAHVIKSEASFFASTVNRANPDTDTSLAAVEPVGEVNHSLNPTAVEPGKFKGAKGTDKDRPEVTAKDVQDLTGEDATKSEKSKVAPKA